MNQKMLFAVGIVCLFSINLVLAAPWIESGVGMCAGSDCDNNSSSSPSYLVNLAVEDEEQNPQMANITLYKTDTGNPINTYSVYGNVSFPLNDQKVDMDVSYDESNLDIKMQNLSVPDLNATNSKIIINDVVVGDFVNASNIHVLRAYKVELPSNFHSSKMILKIAYSDLTVVDENNLVLYRCGNYDLNTDTCISGWGDPLPISIDKNQKFVTLNISSFSVYGLGENETNSTTTTTTTTTTSSTTTTSATTSTTSTSQPQSSVGSSSGGGSGGSYIPPTSSTTTTTRFTTTTSKPIIITTSSTTTTTQTMSTTVSQYFTGMSTFLKSNSYAIVISIVVAAGMLVGWVMFKNKPTTSQKSTYFKPTRYQGKSKKKYSYDETRLVMS